MDSNYSFLQEPNVHLKDALEIKEMESRINNLEEQSGGRSKDDANMTLTSANKSGRKISLPPNYLKGRSYLRRQQNGEKHENIDVKKNTAVASKFSKNKNIDCLFTDSDFTQSDQ